MSGLIRGELKLTIDIILGLLLGEVIIRFRVADILLKHVLPFLVRHNIPKVTGFALGASLGSSRTGAAIISSSLAAHELSEPEAIWSVLMLPFPAYLRRWPYDYERESSRTLRRDICAVIVAEKWITFFAGTILPEAS